MPGGQGAEGIIAQHEEQAVFGGALVVGRQGVMGVGWAGALALKRVDKDPFHPAHGRPRHGHAQREGQHIVVGLVRGAGAGDKIHAIHLPVASCTRAAGIGQHQFPDLDGQAHMSAVHRVEGAAQKPHIHQSRTCPSPRTTNLLVVSSSTPMGP